MNKQIKEIEVINVEIIPSNTFDINSLTAQELKAALRLKNKETQKDRKAYKELVQEELPKQIELLKKASEALSEAKTQVFENLSTVIDFKIKAYGVKAGQQTHTFSMDNGDTITIGYRVTDNYDDTVGEGIAKINNFLSSLAINEKTKTLVDSINRLLKKDAKGNLKPSRVLDLQNMSDDFDNEEFNDGVDIIGKAYKPIKSVYFIEAATKNSINETENIPLSISSVNFEKELEINF